MIDELFQIGDGLKLQAHGELEKSLNLFGDLEDCTNNHETLFILRIRMAALLDQLGKRNKALKILEKLHQENPMDEQIKIMRKKLIYPNGVPSIDNKGFPFTG